MFEPLVNRAMNLYQTTSSVPLQQQILFLMCRLLTLRVNYSLLDTEQTFINSVLKQIELIENGHIRNASQLLPHIFRFLTLLSQEHNKLTDIINSPRLIQLAESLVASVHLRAVSALTSLRPIIAELFRLPSAGSLSQTPTSASANSKDAELQVQREVILASLFKHLRHGEVSVLFALSYHFITIFII